MDDAGLKRLARLAAACFDVSFAQVILFGDGDGVAATPISYGKLFGQEPDLRLACAALPPAAELVVVEDAAKDARFGNGLPTEARFFALANIASKSGHPLGALCLLHDSPKSLTALETEHLIEFASLAAGLCDDSGNRPTRGTAEIECRGHLAALGEALFNALLVTEDGIILEANQRAADLIGISKPEPLIGRPVTDLVPEDQIEKVSKQLAISGVYEVDVVHALGHAMRVEVKAISFSDNGRTIRFAAFRPSIGA